MAVTTDDAFVRQWKRLLREEWKQTGEKKAVLEQTQAYQELMVYYRCAMMEVATKFNILNEELSLKYDRNPIESIKTRLKTPESILGKLNRRGLPVSPESIEINIQDVAGVRVVCSYTSDIYKLAESFASQDDIRVVRTKDYIRAPKPNGYRSLHLIVETPIYLPDEKRMMQVEVQFRTIAMDFWASLEHKIRYKKDLPASAKLEQELLACAEMSAALESRMAKLQKTVDEYIDSARSRAQK